MMLKKSPVSCKHSSNQNNTCEKKIEDLKESTGVMPAKNPPNVKLESCFFNPRMPELRILCVPSYLGFLGYLYWVELPFF